MLINYATALIGIDILIDSLA